MKKNILARTNILVCAVIVVGFICTAALSYQANYNASLQNVEQVSTLTSEGIYYQLSGTFTKPVNISLTMANDSLLKDLLLEEDSRGEDAAYQERIREYLNAYREKYGYDSVFLVSCATGRYYNFNGLDRVLTPGNAENGWYYALLESGEDYSVVVDNDEVAGAENEITVFVNCKIHGEDGAVLGTVGVGLRVKDLQSLLQSYESEFGVSAYLTDGEGKIAISTEHTGFEAVDLFEARGFGGEAREQVLSWTEKGKAKSFWTQGTNGDCYLVARYIPELNWHLLVERNTDALIQEMRRQIAVTVAVIAGIVAIILFVITAVIRSFNRQIVTLTQTAEQERHTMFERATEELYENIYELDITHNRSANQATERYFESLGVPPGTPYDRALQAVAEKQIKEEFRQGYLDTFSPRRVLKAFGQGKETLRYEFMITNDGENYYWMRITGRLMRWETDGSVHMLAYWQNIDTEKRQEARMLELAQTDEMTGFYSKSVSQRLIGEKLKADPTGLHALFLFDIDNFKQANDLYGHAFGDAVILEFTRTLRANFRREDLLGRIGGDEFAAFLPVPGAEWARNRAAVLSEALAHTCGADGKKWDMSASIGVAFSPWDGTDFETLYKKADSALYQTKKNGRNGYTLYHGVGEISRDSPDQP